MIHLILHGGAGSITPQHYTDKQLMLFEESLYNIALFGLKLILNGISSTEAVVACTKLFEDNELFNAGKGSVLNENGDIQMSACLSEGRTGKTGACTLISKIKNPIKLCQVILENNYPPLIGGIDAEKLAKRHKLELKSKNYFKTAHRKKQLLIARHNRKSFLDHELKSHNSGSTVGAIAIDLKKNLAAATSTGGMTNQKAGRISDSAIHGHGNFANKFIAISGTGTGDKFIQENACYQVAKIYERYQNLQLACDLVLSNIKKRGGSGGLIALDSKGTASMRFNSSGMFRASASKKEIIIGIFEDEFSYPVIDK